MKRFFLCFLTVFIGLNASYAQLDVPYISGAGPIGSGSWLRFLSGGSPTSIQENWGLNLTGSNTQPVKIYNASLLVGYTTGGADFGVGNALISGNVGIGTTSPSAKLHIFNSYDAGNTTGFKMFYQGSWGTASYATNFRFIDISSTEGGKVLQANGYGIGIGYDPPAYASADKLYVDGNVGIGTVTPGAKLDVNGNIRLNQNSTLYFDNSNGSFIRQTNGGALDIDASTGAGNGNITLSPASTGSLYLNYGSGNKIFFCNGAATPISVINSDGSMGLGTTDPHGYKLAVNGTIHSKQVIVDLIGWPDYVFKKDYKLMPLAQVKSYIDQNQHLPGLPTDKEVESKGLDVGEMNKLLTKKVEELTLYLIDLKAEKDKEKAALQAANQEQKEQLEKLSKRLEILEKNQ